MLTQERYFQLALRSAAGELLEMLIQRLHDVVVSCLYEPGWYLPVSGAYTLDVKEGATSSNDRFISRVRERMTDLGMEEARVQVKGIGVDITREATQGEAVLEMRLNDIETLGIIWQGKAFVRTSKGDPQHVPVDEIREKSLQLLFDMLATRQPLADAMEAPNTKSPTRS